MRNQLRECSPKKRKNGKTEGCNEQMHVILQKRDGKQEVLSSKYEIQRF